MKLNYVCLYLQQRYTFEVSLCQTILVPCPSFLGWHVIIQFKGWVITVQFWVERWRKPLQNKKERMLQHDIIATQHHLVFSDTVNKALEKACAPLR